jgi:phage major head subunit gpT-like protein
MNESDKNFLWDIQYFWDKKGDIERYAWYDADRLKKLNPYMYQAWINYKQAIDTLNYNSEKIFR